MPTPAHRIVGLGEVATQQASVPKVLTEGDRCGPNWEQEKRLAGTSPSPPASHIPPLEGSDSLLFPQAFFTLARDIKAKMDKKLVSPGAS